MSINPSRAMFETWLLQPDGIDTATHAQLVQVCQWNDANGEFCDLSTEDLRQIVREWLNDD